MNKIRREGEGRDERKDEWDRGGGPDGGGKEGRTKGGRDGRKDAGKHGWREVQRDERKEGVG